MPDHGTDKGGTSFRALSTGTNLTQPSKTLDALLKDMQCLDAVELRWAGLTYEKIAERLDCHRDVARRQVQRGKKLYGEATADELAQLRQGQRRQAQEITRALFPKAAQDDRPSGA